MNRFRVIAQRWADVMRVGVIAGLASTALYPALTSRATLIADIASASNVIRVGLLLIGGLGPALLLLRVRSLGAGHVSYWHTYPSVAFAVLPAALVCWWLTQLLRPQFELLA